MTVTAPIATPTAADAFDELRRLAQAANPGPHHIYMSPRDDDNWRANADFHKAVTPQVVLGLLDKAVAAPDENLIGDDNRPRYTTKRLRDEVARARDQARVEALIEAAELIEANMLCGLGDVEELHPRTSPGNKVGFAYSTAIRKLVRDPAAVADVEARAQLGKLTFAVQHNPNCPSAWLVRLPGQGPIDMKPYGDVLGLVAHQTGDILGFGKTFGEAARKALALTSKETSK